MSRIRSSFTQRISTELTMCRSERRSRSAPVPLLSRRLTDIPRRRTLEDSFLPVRAVPVHYSICHGLQATPGCSGSCRGCTHHHQLWCARHGLPLRHLMTLTVPAAPPRPVPKTNSQKVSDGRRWPLRSIKRPTPDRDNSQGHKMSTAYSTNPIINTMPQTHDANGFVRPGSLRRRAIPMHTGHHRQPDGSVVRVDIEMGRWVGSLYTPEMKIKTRIIGSELEVHAWADRISV
jgi:hypothetical protein